MALEQLQLNSQALALDYSAADKLLQLGNGDAALLYLYLLRRQGSYDPVQAVGQLRWSRSQLDTALAQLQEVGLLSGAALAESTPVPPPQPDQAPSYTARQIADALQEQGSDFPGLLKSIEQMFGRPLTNSQLSILLELYDHVGLPADVLLILVSWLCERTRRKYGPGRNPTFSVIKRTGYQWKERGYDTFEAANEYIAAVDYRESQEGGMLAALGIFGRRPTATEGGYLRQWLDWGFSPEMAAQAYDITVTKTGRLNWKYCDSILRRWREQGIRTPEQAQADQRKGQAQSPAARTAAKVPAATVQQVDDDYLAEIQRFRAQKDGGATS